MALYSPGTVENVQGLVKASQMVSAYVEFVASLNEDITQLPDFKTIDEHLKSAKANAQYWKTQLYPEYKAAAKGIQNMAESFVASIKHLEDLASQLKSNTSGAKETVEKELRSLLDAVAAQQTEIAKVSDSIGKFSDNEEENIRNFHSDIEKAETEIVGDQKELKSLQDEIKGIDKAITRDKALIAGGILSIWIAVGAGIDLKKQEDAKKSVEKQISMKKQELVNIFSFKHQYDKFNMAGEDVSQALTQMQNGWDSLSADIQQVVDQLKTLSGLKAFDYMKPLLESALKDWKIVVEVAKTL